MVRVRSKLSRFFAPQPVYDSIRFCLSVYLRAYRHVHEAVYSSSHLRLTTDLSSITPSLLVLCLNRLFFFFTIYIPGCGPEAQTGRSQLQ
jgi:hypothetical protein